MSISKHNKPNETDAARVRALVKRYDFLTLISAGGFLTGIIGTGMLYSARDSISSLWWFYYLLLFTLGCCIAFGTAMYFELWEYTGTAKEYRRYIARLIQSSAGSDTKHLIDALQRVADPDQRLAILESVRHF